MIRVIIAGILLPWIVQSVGDELIQGDGKVVTETRALETFDQIELRVAADMHVTIGKPIPLTIETDQNIMPLIKMEVRKGSTYHGRKHHPPLYLWRPLWAYF